ncbi:MAG: hypothetical protein ACTS4X_01705 [Candidatus Hodgkinia cicadicola]
MDFRRSCGSQLLTSPRLLIMKVKKLINQHIVKLITSGKLTEECWLETRRRLLLNGQLRWWVMLLTQSAWTATEVEGCKRLM